MEEVAVDGGTMMVDGIIEMQFRILGFPSVVASGTNMA